jgi:alpha-1,2-rhamnosyltransferase
MRIFIDCSNAHATGLNTGIQRVVRAFSAHLPQVVDASVIVRNVVVKGNGFSILERLGPVVPPGNRLRPRQLANDLYLRAMRGLAARLPSEAARRFLLAHKSEFGLAYCLTAPLRFARRVRPHRVSSSEPSLAFAPGDILFLSDGIWMHEAREAVLAAGRDGALIVPFIHDIIPVTHPQFCHPSFIKRFSGWLEWILPASDGLIFNSQHSLDTLAEYLRQHRLVAPPQENWQVVYLGNDLPVQDTEPSCGAKLRAVFRPERAVFLSVGTLEARKNQACLLAACERLWTERRDIVLLLIGRSGGMCHELVQEIRHHPQWAKRLFWFEAATDRDLMFAYGHARALIFPSLEEGFGLPLVEALSLGLETVCSDLPVFREIAQEHSRYFPPADSAALATILRELASCPPRPPLDFTWPDWQESARRLYRSLLTIQSSKF